MISEGAVWAIWGLPLAAFVIIGALVPSGVFRRTPRLAAGIALAAMLGSFILALIALRDVYNNNGEVIGYGTHHWLTLGTLQIDLGIHLDGLTAVMLVVVTSVSFLVQFYSMEYIKGDIGFARYYAEISLFTMAMLGLLLADNLLMIFVFWELVGLCSYLLIGFWFDRESSEPEQLSPRASAKKAFLVTRLGDVGFLLALLLIWTRAGTFNIAELQEMAHSGALSQTTLLLFCIGIFAGAAGKSAQFPLHTWLPDAMAGPTPVSALIHAATMVAAGVYLVGRLFPIFQDTDHALQIVTAVGAITALLAASMGMVQSDIKRVLAYSTISQLGYMMLSLGVFGYTAAFFHLFTHAFFKALLFLGAGSVSHSTNTFDMRKMGGLRRYMPVTFWTFLIGSISLAGVPPLAGFWSKDEILRFAYERGTTESKLAFAAAMAVVFMTAFYMFRAIAMTFLGDYRGGEPAAAHGGGHGGGSSEPAGGHPNVADEHGAASGHGAPAHAFVVTEDSMVASQAREDAHGDAHGGHGMPHESPWIITLPLLILTVPAVLAGLLNAGQGWFHTPLSDMVNGALPEFAREAEEGSMNVTLAVLSSLLALLGIVSALVLYGFGSRWQVRTGPLKPLYLAAKHRYGLDEVYERGIAGGLVVGLIGGLGRLLDGRVIDGVVNGVAWLTRRLALGLTRVQNGQQQTYGMVFLGGVALIAAVMFAVGL